MLFSLINIKRLDIPEDKMRKVMKNVVQEEVPEKDRNLKGSFNEKSEVLSVLNPPKCFIYKHLGGFSRL